jgi:hypothetical protein
MAELVEFTDASSAYVVYRREKKQSRSEAVKSARSDLQLKSAVEALGKTGKK